MIIFRKFTSKKAAERGYIADQIAWWQKQGIPAYEAHEALYGHTPLVMTFSRLEKRMTRDFSRAYTEGIRDRR